VKAGQRRRSKRTIRQRACENRSDCEILRVSARSIHPRVASTRKSYLGLSQRGLFHIHQTGQCCRHATFRQLQVQKTVSLVSFYRPIRHVCEKFQGARVSLQHNFQCTSLQIWPEQRSRFHVLVINERRCAYSSGSWQDLSCRRAPHAHEPSAVGGLRRLGAAGYLW